MPVLVKNFNTSGYFSIFVAEITQFKFASKTNWQKPILGFKVENPNNPKKTLKIDTAHSFRRLEAKTTCPPLCDITAKLEAVTKSVGVLRLRAWDAAINALLATPQYCRTIVKFIAHFASLSFYSSNMRTPHNHPPQPSTWLEPDKNGSGCSNLKRA